MGRLHIPHRNGWQILDEEDRTTRSRIYSIGDDAKKGTEPVIESSGSDASPKTTGLEESETPRVA